MGKKAECSFRILIMNGFFLIDKGSGVGSFSVISAVRRLTRVKKVGHAGTLDPLATGLLLVAVGDGTKLLEYFIGSDKEYEVLAKFGAVSDSYDADGEIEETGFSGVLSDKEVQDTINSLFLGEIDQMPPKYSALKVKGKRACDIVRAGGDVELKSRKVQIDGFEMIGGEWPELKFRVNCGSGTYIRSLVHDLGQELGSGAYVLELNRTKIGDFLLENAKKLDEIDKIEDVLIPFEDVLSGFEVLALSDEEFEGLSDGRVLLSKKFDHDVVVMALYRDKLVGVLENSSDGTGIKYKKRIFS